MPLTILPPPFFVLYTQDSTIQEANKRCDQGSKLNIPLSASNTSPGKLYPIVPSWN